MTNYESIYYGSESLLDPPRKAYVSAGYHLDIGELGTSLDPRTANQLGELNTKINPGLQHIEVSGVDANVFESIPEQHLEEINKLSKITGVTTSLHGPIVEASGVGERGFDEANRVGAEKQIESAVLRSHKLDPKGNVSVTTHTTAGLPELEPTVRVKDEEGKEREITTGLYIIDEDTGKIQQIQPERRAFPEEGTGEFVPRELWEFDARKELNKINRDQWTQLLSGVNRYSTWGDEILDRVKLKIKSSGVENEDDIFLKLAKGDVDKIKDKHKPQKALLKDFQRDITGGQIYLRDAYRNLQVLFDKAYSGAVGKDKKRLEEYGKKIAPSIQKGIEDDPEKIPELREIVENGLKVLGRLDETPKIFKPLKEFVINKSAETFANVAESSYNEFGRTAPLLNIENPPAGGGLSRAEDVKNIVKASREKMAENLVKRKNVSKGEAKRIAEQMIGATWDVGHINMLRKKGYSEKDIIKETEIIAPYVKHLHLSDNFGLNHTELPMGMGNVPLKEIMQRLGEKGFEGQKIIEAGNWWQYFAEKGGGNPFKPSIEAFDSPLYAMKAGPSWGQTVDTYGFYYGGHGPINPPVHHSTYGAGFQNLPVELGGELPGDRDRFSGTPNQ